MYLATQTEILIFQALLDSEIGKDPALAFLLASPSLSLLSILVIRSFLGTKKAVAYVSLVVILPSLTVYIFGLFNN